MSHRNTYRSFAHANISARETVESFQKKNKYSNRSPKSTAQKTKDSMQPSDELAAIFGVCPKPSFSRVKE